MKNGLLDGRNRHLTFAAVCLTLLLALWLTGGGRDDVRARALTESALLRAGLVSDEGGALTPARLDAWRRTVRVLEHGGLAAPLGLSERLPLRLEHSTPAADVDAQAVTLRQLGIEPVSVREDGTRLTVGGLLLGSEPATGGRLAVTARYSHQRGAASPGFARAPDGEYAAARIAGPWWAVLPPLLAVVIALFYGRAVIALAAAVVLGAALGRGMEPVGTVIGALGYVWASLTDSFKLYILGFTMALVGMVQVTARSGGNQGLIDAIGRLAKRARSTRLATFVMGLVVFFDDYANALVVGTSARSLTDRVRISREKLAFIVDATAAPVAGIALISTWVGYEIGLFDALSSELDLGYSGIGIFFAVMPTRFYCLLMLLFVLVNAWSGRDFGPMLRAEQRAAKGDVGAVQQSALTKRLLARIEPAAGTPMRWYNAAVPVVLTLVGVVVGIAWDGTRAIAEAGGPAADLGTVAGWREVFSAADNGFVLFVAASVGSVCAIGMAVGQRILSVRDALGAWVAGVRMMSIAVAILLLAWCIRDVTEDLGTSAYLVSVLEPVLHPSVLPFVIFLAASAVAFATGTSWGTMGILLPALIPMAWAMTGGDLLMTFLCMGAVLDGAIFGDHCSPISDTTVMSSLASGCDHVAHVRTQLPYAVAVMALAGGCGYALVPTGLPVVVCYLLGAVGICALVYGLGRKVPEAA